MIAVDTNIIVHVLVADNASQTARGRTVLESDDIFVCTTVLLETEWVLRSVYGLPPKAISIALRSFCGLPRILLENELILVRALDWMEAGMDFADALHLACSDTTDAFATFDKALVRRAKRLGATKATLA